MTQKQNEFGATRHTPRFAITKVGIDYHAYDGDTLIMCDTEYYPLAPDRVIAEMFVHSANSYAKHCKDPIAAAEGDLLGQALSALAGCLGYIEQSLAHEGKSLTSAELIAETKRIQETVSEVQTGFWWGPLQTAKLKEARAILAQCKEV